jgi:hypothetical protein
LTAPREHTAVKLDRRAGRNLPGLAFERAGRIDVLLRDHDLAGTYAFYLGQIKDG